MHAVERVIGGRGDLQRAARRVAHRHRLTVVDGRPDRGDARLRVGGAEVHDERCALPAGGRVAGRHGRRRVGRRRGRARRKERTGQRREHGGHQRRPSHRRHPPDDGPGASPGHRSIAPALRDAAEPAPWPPPAARATGRPAAAIIGSRQPSAASRRRAPAAHALRRRTTQHREGRRASHIHHARHPPDGDRRRGDRSHPDAGRAGIRRERLEGRGERHQPEPGRSRGPDRRPALGGGRRRRDRRLDRRRHHVGGTGLAHRRRPQWRRLRRARPHGWAVGARRR